MTPEEQMKLKVYEQIVMLRKAGLSFEVCELISLKTVEIIRAAMALNTSMAVELIERMMKEEQS